MEIWKDIKGYEGLYQISSLGRVKSLKRIDYIGRARKEKILKYGIRNGYPYVVLCCENRKKKYSIHRLVAEHFIDNPLNKSQIDHINTDKTDNRVENLRWTNQSENINNPLTIEKKRKCGLIPVIQLSRQGKPLRYFESGTEARKTTKIENIHTCCKGRQTIAGNFRWMYFEDFCDLY